MKVLIIIIALRVCWQNFSSGLSFISSFALIFVLNLLTIGAVELISALGLLKLLFVHAYAARMKPPIAVYNREGSLAWKTYNHSQSIDRPVKSHKYTHLPPSIHSHGKSLRLKIRFDCAFFILVRK